MYDLKEKIISGQKNIAALTDAMGHLVYLSHEARILLGIDGDKDILGKPFHAVLSGNNNHSFPAPGKPGQEVSTPDLQGTAHVMFASIAAHKGKDGRIAFFSYQMPEDSFFQTISPKDTTFFKSSDHLNTEGQKSAGPDYNNILQQMEISRIFSALAEPVIIYDASGSPVLANTAAVKMIGFDPTGMPWEEFIQKKALLYPNGRPVPFDKLPCKRALDGAIVHSEKFVRVNAKGEERIYEFNAVSLVRDEKIIGAVTVARDETESTRLMDQLETERTALQAIIHNAPEAIIVVDQECRIVMTNPAARQLYQQSPEGIMAGSMGPGYADFSPPYDPVDLPLARSVFHGEMIVDHEMAISLPNGLCRHILVNTAPIRNPRGEVTGAVGVFHDITQRKRERLELQRARTELEKRVEERTAELRHTVNTLREEIEERKKIENRLQDSQDNLRHLSHRMLHTLESDRQKIARELHDSLGASLAAIKFSLEEKLAQMPTNPPDDILSIESIVSYLTTTIKETKRISANLRPTILDDLGLLPTITWFCREFQSFYRNIRIEEKIRIREEEIDESMKIVIYRILQEAINNAAKHGNPNTINLVLTKKDSRVELTVDDDGNGFDLKDKLNSSDPMSGNGIQGMKERADICGGDFKILSHPGTGTRVHVSLPGHPYSAC